MKLKILLFTVGILLTSCASPYQYQANLLTQAYQRGEISTSDYHARINELQSLELQRRTAASQAFFNYSQGVREQQYLRQMRQPYYRWPR